MNLTSEIVARSLAVDVDCVPEDVLQTARHAVLDVMACGLLGAKEPAVALLFEEALDEGGRAAVPLIGYEQRVNRHQAARINATASHILDYDDSAEAADSHLSSPIVHALLALGHSIDASGAHVLAAYVAGYEAACQIAQTCNVTELYRRGWHATSVVGVLGVAIACSRLLNLSSAATSQAVGIAATQAAGLKASFGTMCKSLHAGEASSRGMRAALLAGCGFTSCDHILEAPQGYAWCFSGQEPIHSIGSVATDVWYLRRNLFKYHAACHLTHAYIEAAQALRERDALRVDRIARITLRASPMCLDVCNIGEPRTGLEGKFSLSHVVAMALHGFNTADATLFSDDMASHPGLKALRARTQVLIENDRDRLTARVEITTDDGRCHAADSNTAITHDPGTSQAKVRAKFVALGTPILGSARTLALQDAILDIDRLGSISQILEAAARP